MFVVLFFFVCVFCFCFAFMVTFKICSFLTYDQLTFSAACILSFFPCYNLIVSYSLPKITIGVLSRRKFWLFFFFFFFFFNHLIWTESISWLYYEKWIRSNDLKRNFFWFSQCPEVKIVFFLSLELVQWDITPDLSANKGKM